MSNGHEVVYPAPDPVPQPTDEEVMWPLLQRQTELEYEDRVAAIAAYEGSFSEMEKLALETLARTARDPLFCFELSLSMMRLRTRLGKMRAELSKAKKANV